MGVALICLLEVFPGEEYNYLVAQAPPIVQEMNEIRQLESPCGLWMAGAAADIDLFLNFL